MVLQAIKQKLGAPAQATPAPAAPAAAHEDIPDELPPLMEEEHASAPSPVAPAKKEIAPAPQELPDELPSLSDIPAEAMAPPIQPRSTAATEKKIASTVSEPSPKVDAGISATNDILADLDRLEKEMSSVSTTSTSPQLMPELGPSRGFFGTLKTVASQSPDLQEELVSEDILTRMKSYWAAKQATPEGSWDSEKRITEQIEACMRTLQALESKWHVQAMALEHERQLLTQREQEIKEKGKELQMLHRALRYYRKVPESKAFSLCNGMKIQSIKELFDAVSVVDDHTLHHHLNSKKNDFTEWVENVVKDTELANAMANTRTRGSLLKTIENMISNKPAHATTEPGAIPKHRMRQASPDKYFHAADGKVIKSLEELPLAISQMTQSTFDHHVNPHRNDFAAWVNAVFKKHDLARRMELATSQKEMVNVLEVYL